MKKVLIVTQRFYPDPKVAAVRMTQWAKWLPEHGWKPIVACRNSGASLSREDIARKIHPDAEIVYLNEQPVPAGRNSGSAARWLRANAIRLFGPSILGAPPRNPLLRKFKEGVTKLIAQKDRAVTEAFWRGAENRIVEWVRIQRPDAVITTSPPNAVHSVGLRLKKEFPGLFWMADFRDVFRQGGPYRVGVLQRYQSLRSFHHEGSIYRTADWVTCATPAHQRWIKRRFPECASKTVTVLNGAPEELCMAARESRGSGRGSAVKVIGFSEAQESVVLARAVAALRKAGEDIDLRFVGDVPKFRPEIEDVLGGHAVFTGPVPHDRALEDTISARVLVAVLSENRSQIPAIASKLFEYLAIPAPVIVLNPSNAARTMFSRLDGVQMLKKPDQADIEAALKAAMNVRQESLQSRALMVQERWSRRSQVRKLASILDDLCEGHGRNAQPKTVAALPSEAGFG